MKVIMKGTYLGEFEELILLTVGILYADAYGVAIQEEVGRQTGRRVRIGSIHSALKRLEEKGFLISEMGGATDKRGGRKKRIFSITEEGKRALVKAKDQRNQLWNQMHESIMNSMPS